MKPTYEIPANVNILEIIERLSARFQVNQVAKHYTLKSYYDSFDWRLWRHDLICEFNRSNTHSHLNLVNRKTSELVASTVLFDLPAYARQFNTGIIRKTLESSLKDRALLAIGTIECDISQFEVLDEDNSLLMHIMLEEYQSLNACLSIFPGKGNEKTIKAIMVSLIEEFNLVRQDNPILMDVLRLQGRHPKDYTGNLSFALEPDMCPVAAYKTIFKALLKIIKVNEQGVIADTDSEFLHDFRVAVRKTRVGLNQAKQIFPDDILAKQKLFFAWLGQITGETRDLDVYLLRFEDYKKHLPKDMKQSINPLQHFLLAKKQKAHKILAQKLRSLKYKTGIKQWEEFLSSSQPAPTDDKADDFRIKSIADQKLRKLFQQALKQGEAIDKHSPPEALHKLRKTCKKLRYVIEFFHSLYPPKHTEHLVKRLKQLQTVLGNYQDFAVQQHQLEQFCDQMQKTNVPSRTFLAMGLLIQNLAARQVKAQNRFHKRFDQFNNPKSKAEFKTLLR